MWVNFVSQGDNALVCGGGSCAQAHRDVHRILSMHMNEEGVCEDSFLAWGSLRVLSATLILSKNSRVFDAKSRPKSAHLS